MRLWDYWGRHLPEEERIILAIFAIALGLYIVCMSAYVVFHGSLHISFLGGRIL
jgi:hypothetical protein